MSERSGIHRHALDFVSGELDRADGSDSEELEDDSAKSETNRQSHLGLLPAPLTILVQIAWVHERDRDRERHTAVEHYADTLRDSDSVSIGPRALTASVLPPDDHPR